MRPERHLTTNAQLADFAVNLSNVVRDRRLGGDRPADLARFTGLIEGLIAFTNDEFVRVYDLVRQVRRYGEVRSR